jgi:hypothetical protein
MKTCPSCHKIYQDESLVFCLDDGSRLVRERSAFDSNATWNLPPPGPTVASPRPTSPGTPATITTHPEQFHQQVRGDASRIESRSSALPWVFAIVLVLGVAGVLIAWFMTRDRADNLSNRRQTPTPVSDAMTTPSPGAMIETDKRSTPNDRPTATPSRPAKEADQPISPPPAKERPKPMFAMLNNTSFDGTRITYYQRPSFALCQADCAGNANCKGLTWIRPGAYNPSDPGMCYLMSAVTQKTSHTCCISAVKN